VSWRYCSEPPSPGLVPSLGSEEDVVEKRDRTVNYDKEKYREMIPDAAETVLGTFGFNRTVYGDTKKGNGKWWQELIQERRRDIQTEIT
jgi:hypothetical protein